MFNIGYSDSDDSDNEDKSPNTLTTSTNIVNSASTSQLSSPDTNTKAISKPIPIPKQDNDDILKLLAESKKLIQKDINITSTQHNNTNLNSQPNVSSLNHSSSQKISTKDDQSTITTIATLDENNSASSIFFSYWKQKQETSTEDTEKQDTDDVQNKNEYKFTFEAVSSANSQDTDKAIKLMAKVGTEEKKAKKRNYNEFIPENAKIVEVNASKVQKLSAEEEQSIIIDSLAKYVFRPFLSQYCGLHVLKSMYMYVFNNIIWIIFHFLTISFFIYTTHLTCSFFYSILLLFTTFDRQMVGTTSNFQAKMWDSNKGEDIDSADTKKDKRRRTHHITQLAQHASLAHQQSALENAKAKLRSMSKYDDPR